MSKLPVTIFLTLAHQPVRVPSYVSRRLMLAGCDMRMWKLVSCAFHCMARNERVPPTTSMQMRGLKDAMVDIFKADCINRDSSSHLMVRTPLRPVLSGVDITD